MNEEFEYLSDEELQKLINETESAGLLQAPPDFEASVMKRIEEAAATQSFPEQPGSAPVENETSEQNTNTISFEEKKKQYSRFKFQVCMAMAAAILFLLVAPFIATNENYLAIKEATATAQLQKRNDNTKYISDIFGNHVISDTISNTGFNMEDKQ